MSSLVMANAGKQKLLDLFLSGASTNLRVVLFKNNYTPVASTAWADLTESDFPGYGRATPTFGAATLSSTKGRITDSSARTFTCTGGGSTQQAYGYAVVWTTGGTPVVLWAEKFDSSQTMLNNGDAITITAQYDLDTAA